MSGRSAALSEDEVSGPYSPILAWPMPIPADDALRFEHGPPSSPAMALERARAAVSALEALGVPAAVLSSSGHVRAANALLDDVAPVARTLPCGRMALGHAGADRLFRDAIDGLGPGRRAVPAPDRRGGDAYLIWLAPLGRPACDLFQRRDILVTVTRVGVGRQAPRPDVLAGLFDLTPAETRVAEGLARGLSLQQAAAENGLRPSTARTYLDQIFRKTGTHRQGELVALLGSADAFR